MSKLPATLLEAIESAWVSHIDDDQSQANQTQIYNLENKLEKAKQILKEKSLQKVQLEKLVSVLTQEFEQHKHNAQQHIIALETALKEKQIERNELTSQLQEATDKIQALQHDIQILKTNDDEQLKYEQQKKLWLSELDNRGTLLASLQIELRRLSDNYQQLRVDNESLVKGNAMLQSRSIQLSDKFDDITDKLQQKHKECLEKDRHIEILQRQLKLAEHNVRHLKIVKNEA